MCTQIILQHLYWHCSRAVTIETSGAGSHGYTVAEPLPWKRKQIQPVCICPLAISETLHVLQVDFSEKNPKQMSKHLPWEEVTLSIHETSLAELGFRTSHRDDRWRATYPRRVVFFPPVLSKSGKTNPALWKTRGCPSFSIRIHKINRKTQKSQSGGVLISLLPTQLCLSDAAIHNHLNNSRTSHFTFQAFLAELSSITSS